MPPKPKVSGSIDERLSTYVRSPEFLPSLTSMPPYMAVDALIKFAQSQDFLLQRTKKPILVKSAEKVLSEYIHTDTDFSQPPDTRSSEQPDDRSMNSSIVDLWKKDSDSTPEPSRKRDRTGKELKKKQDRSPPANVRLSDLGGVDSTIERVLELIAMPLLHPEVYIHTGIDPPRGVLLHGPPGCGKTLLANAIAGELGVPFISISAPSVISGMSGESEKKIREVFDEARSLAPCLMFIDEIDAITPKRESAQREMERRVVAQLLTSMDSLSMANTGGQAVVIIGATNRPDSLDAALRRAGRFDTEIAMTVPSEASRERILRVLSKKLRITGDFDFAALAKMTPGFVGADLNALTSAAGVCAIKRIFEYLKGTEIDTSSMDVDDSPSSLIKKFIDAHPDPLTPEQLEPLSISLADFITALPTIQPSSKREGFTTVPDVTWADVGALGPIRKELQMAIVQPIMRPDLYKSVGITAPSGVLLWGPPGCGKTLLAKAVANESRANFISVRGPELLNKYVGESERAVRQVFLRARASVPCVIFFDELDALVPKRDEALSESSARVVNTLLTELDGLNDRQSVYVIGATNRPDMIDAAMLRPGRLDKPLFVQLPTETERYEILRTLTRKTPLSDDVDIKLLAADNRGRNFSGADLAALVREAAVVALHERISKSLEHEHSENGIRQYELPPIYANESDEQIKVGAIHFEKAFNNVKPSVSDEDRGKYDRLSRQLGWN
ncbi:hypothetical protein CANCADRAFT_73317 [Tortispora caseinolytica NRRL Y-17796]|uniref:AAA+ ATPase domain-containing protein n=1 Tax=Tortispora caseinolytica NRRL Y-17796 TaxID=767744 RepID=A0A1E4TIJ9_9ASCO|nr:hypothetical protein CANCADRAFT_73317 [Tortispora caseinolytica NRRL Y-17796]